MALLGKVTSFIKGVGKIFGISTLEDRVHNSIRELKLPGFDSVKFSRGSKEILSLYDVPPSRDLFYPEAVIFGEKNGGRLQSLKDAVVYRVASNGADGSNIWQHTSDWALYFRLGGVNTVAFVDGYGFVDRQGRSLISHCQEGFDANCAGREFFLPFSEFDPYSVGCVPVLLDLLVERGLVKCIVDVPEKNLVLPTKKSVEGVYFGNHPIVTSLLSSKISEVYSGYLVKQGYKEGRVLFPSRAILNNVPDGLFLCRPVGLSFGNDFYDINVGNQFNGSRCARGVVHLPQTSNRQLQT